MEGDGSDFHELLCRQSFERAPATNRGIRAQRALQESGTLANGKVYVTIRESHGTSLRELVAGVRFDPGEAVTLYGGLLEPGRKETVVDTHARHIPLMDCVLNGKDFANAFPSSERWHFNGGHTVKLKPHCANKHWDKVICTTGIGYMANTVTKCPLYQQLRPNVVVAEMMLGRVIVGVPYTSILVLVAGQAGIEAGDRIISLYEHGSQKEKFKFRCVDPIHYITAGQPLP